MTYHIKRAYRKLRVYPIGFLLFLIAGPSLLSALGEGGSEKGIRDELIRTLQNRSIPYDERPLMAGYGGFNSSIHVVLSPRALPNHVDPGENAGAFTLAIPLSPTPPADGGTIGGALPFNVETGIAFIEKIRDRGTGREIRVAFLGDEGTSLPPDMARQRHKGLEDLCALPEIPENAFLWYLDLASPPAALLIHHGTERSIAPRSLLEPLPSLAKAHRIPYFLAIHFNEIYKLALADGPSALALTAGWGINALYITGREDAPGYRVPEGPPLDAAALADLLTEYSAILDTQTENLDTHYSIVDLPGMMVFISEGATMALFFLVAAVFLLYQGIYAVRRRKTTAIRRIIFIRHAWLLLLFLILLVAALRGAGFFFSLLCRIFAVPLPVRYDAAALCFVFAMAIFSLASPVLEKVRVPWKEVFYGDGALLMVGAGVLIAAALNITFIPIFIWAFLFILIGHRVRNPVLVYICALATPFLAFTALINIMEAGNRKIAASFLGGNLFICLYIGLVCLPFILLMKRGALLIRKRRQPFIPRLILGALSVVLLVLHVKSLSEHRDPSPTRRLIDIADARAPLVIGFTDRIFLESRIVEIRLEGPGTPVRFDLSLESDTPGVPPEIYSAPMPVMGGEGNSRRFILGEGPPNPLAVELILPLDFSGALRAEALYAAWDETVDPGPPPPNKDYVLRLVSTLRLNRRPSGLPN